jgi:hypothetical protein
VGPARRWAVVTLEDRVRISGRRLVESLSRGDLGTERARRLEERGECLIYKLDRSRHAVVPAGVRPMAEG